MDRFVDSVLWNRDSDKYASCKFISRKTIDSFNITEWRVRLFILARVKYLVRILRSHRDARRLISLIIFEVG